MRKFGLSSLAFAAGLLLVCGCSTLKIPSEDLEVADLCADEIAVLRDPKLSPMSREKYEAAKALIAKVDFSYTRETKTLNDILYYGDAAVHRSVLRLAGFSLLSIDNLFTSVARSAGL